MMTVDELEVLIAKVEARLNCNLFWGRNSLGTWFAYPHQCDERSDCIDGATMPEVIAKLREWATPPRPETLTITVPFEAADRLINGPGWSSGGSVEPFVLACQEALKPWAQS